jgi:predicted 2-oxoglutarate/Fe(II)-dependent dioxygenase YbiX
MRQILFDLHAVSSSLRDTQPDSVEVRLLSKVQSNLLRKLAET